MSEETRSFQYLSFYQKEMALYLYHNMYRGMPDMCLDAELQPLFKVWNRKCGVGGWGWGGQICGLCRNVWNRNRSGS